MKKNLKKIKKIIYCIDDLSKTRTQKFFYFEIGNIIKYKHFSEAEVKKIFIT